jgi:Family of unknown function (DUF5808)
LELHGRVMGIPYDFRMPTWSKLQSHYWNPEDERIFIPRAFGIGWDINLYRLRERYPAVFYVLLSLTILSTVLRCAARIRGVLKKKRDVEF